MKYLISLIILLALPISAASGDAYKTSPAMNKGEKWRIGYCQGGPYTDYQGILKSTIRGLMRLGWMEKTDFPELPDNEDTKTLWTWLSEKAPSPHIRFVADAYWDSGWQEEARQKNKARMLERLAKGKDIDLMIAMGTWAGQDLANDEHSVPVVVMSSADPIRAGIVRSVKDSGRDHVHARCDPTRYVRQVKLFHDIFGFRNMGIVYENTPMGKIYSNLEEVEKVAKKRNFRIVSCHARDDLPLLADDVAEVSRCYEKLAPEIDALYLSYLRGENEDYMPALLEPLLRHRVPTWTAKGASHVRRGVLMSIARKNFDELGLFEAGTIARILNGAKPRYLEQEFRESLKLAINLETARQIGYRPPRNVLRVADMVYENIEHGPRERELYEKQTE